MAALLALAACARPTPYAEPTFSFLPHYRGGNSLDRPVLLTNSDWWTRLHDPVLNTLVDRALSQNLSIAIAGARLDQARALVDTVSSTATLSSTAQVRGQGTDNNGPHRAGIDNFGFDWLFDNTGSRRAQLKAAAGRVEIADAQVDAARLTIVYNLVNVYLQLRYHQRLVALADTHLGSRRKMLDITRTMEEAQSATRIDTTRAAARVADIETQRPVLMAAVTTAANQIAVLTGVQPGQLGIDLSSRAQPLARIAPDMGIPADLVRNRPDIRIAERTYYVDIAQIDKARAALYPSLSLSGTVTLTSLQGSSAAAEYYLGPALHFPSLPLGPARASVKAAHAQAQQDYLSWTDTVLNALLEVENALANYRASVQALAGANRSVKLNDQAYTLSVELFQRGAATLNDVLNADDDRTTADNTLAQAAYQQALAFVTLNVKLGSGSGGPEDNQAATTP